MSEFNSIQGGAGVGRASAGSKSGASDKASSTDMRSWYEAMAGAWGNALDGQAAKITQLSDKIGSGGEDSPAAMTMLSAESMRMQFMSTSASTATSSVGKALETLARKQ